MYLSVHWSGSPTVRQPESPLSNWRQYVVALHQRQGLRRLTRLVRVGRLLEVQASVLSWVAVAVIAHPLPKEDADVLQ